MDEAPRGHVGQDTVGLICDLPPGSDRHLDGLRRTRRRPALLLGDRRELVARPRAVPLVHDVPDHLDPVAGPEQGAQRPGLVAEHPALETQPLANGAMEELARPRRVEHQARVGDQRLAPWLADVRPVVLPGDPRVHAVGPDPLSDDGQRIGRHGGVVQRGEGTGQHPVVAVKEGQPLAANQGKPQVARSGGPGILSRPHEHDPRIAIGQGPDQVRGPVGGCIVHHDALDGWAGRVQDGVERTLDRAGRVPARDQDTDLRGGIGHGWVHCGDGPGEHTLADVTRRWPGRPGPAHRVRAP